jgi:DNA processing protein
MAGTSAGTRGIALTDRQRIAWLRLIRSDNVGPVTFRDLINHFGSAEAALEALPELSARGGSTRAIRVAGRAEAEAELEIANRFGSRFIGIGEPDYPFALKQCCRHLPATGDRHGRFAQLFDFRRQANRDAGT